MNKCLMSAVAGMILGIYIGYAQEEELTDICHKSKKTKKKMMKKLHRSYDHVCDCLDLD